MTPASSSVVIMHARTGNPGGRTNRGRRTAGVVAVGLAAVTVLLALTGCDPSGSTASQGDPGADRRVTLVPADRRGQPVNLSGVTLDGARVDAAAFRGVPVVLNVWSSTCAPCRAEAPDLQAAYLELKPSGVAFIGIDQRDDDPAQARAFVRGFGITYPSIADTGGQALLALRGAAPPNVVPTTLVLDGEGRVAARVSGAVDRATLVALVADVRTPNLP